MIVGNGTHQVWASAAYGARSSAGSVELNLGGNVEEVEQQLRQRFGDGHILVQGVVINDRLVELPGNLPSVYPPRRSDL